MSRLEALIAKIIDPLARADGPPPRRFVSFARWSLRGSERVLGIACVVVILAAAAEMAVAYFTGLVIDAAAQGEPGSFWSQFWPIIVGGLVFFLVLRPIILAADSANGAVLIEPHLFPLVLNRLHGHTLGHSMRYFDNDFAGRISQKQMQTARALTGIVTECLDVVVYCAVMFLIGLAMMASVDAWLLMIFAVWGTLYGLTLWYFIPKLQRRSAARASARTQITGLIVDTLTNIATVKLFAQDGLEDRATRDVLDQYRGRALHFGAMAALFRLALTTLGGMLPLFSILGALFVWSRGGATPGDIAMTAMVAVRLSQITQRLGRSAMAISADIGEVEDGIATLTPPHEITDRRHAGSVAEGPGAVAYEDIHFAYGGKVPALDGFDLRIDAGEKVALVGTSGAGKSTAMSLLLRLYDVEGGRITLDGRDIRDLTQHALRQRIAVVRQETAMFNRSAADNIRYGRPAATDDEVMAAAQRAQAHDFIETLIDHKGRAGYHAYLGERGVKLSGGQRQRIALARALLKDSPVLVLDEATSALDSEVEALIQHALGEAMQGKTVIAIAHRLSTIARMDRIVVMSAGRIVEQGTHTALLARSGAYAALWQRQSGGFLGLDAGQAAE